MSSEYPDVLGDLVDARHRFEVNGVHYVMIPDPTTIAPGGLVNLRCWLQNCWNVPVEVVIEVHLPSKPAPAFSIIQNRTDVPLEAAEVGELTIPIACSPEAVPSAYVISVISGVKAETQGLYVRSKENKGHFEDSHLSFTTGMALSATMGLGFVAHTQPRQEFTLQVEGTPEPESSPDLTPTYLSHWTMDLHSIQGKARQLVNDQRLHLLPYLTIQALYKSFLEESQARFQDANLPLHIGEAIFLAKILTHTVRYFLKLPDGHEAVLVPAYVLAYRYNLPTNDPVFLLVRADYARMARLAVSLSFGMLRRRIGRDIWSMEEQLALTDLIADRVERGGTLPAEFLYLPLLLGGLIVADQVQMPGEQLEESLNLLAKARQQRAEALAEIPELVALLDRLQKHLQSAS
ncbi:MAG: hypothetical protein P8189_02360 [Anaerolineae bacterium]